MLSPTRDVMPGDCIMMSALAVADAIETMTGLRTEIKWPNDVLLGGGKVCGILAESSVQDNRRRIILGIGINVNVDPAGDARLPSCATSLSCETGEELEREGLITHLFYCLNIWYRCLSETPDDLFAAWTARLNCIGRPLLVADASGTWYGEGVGVQRDGGLLIRGEGDTVRTVYSADVSIRDREYRTVH
jgi:BirA family biotin operon repressor/biotin-[acetyl-CoA-carboxylase] ligase